MLNVYPFTSLRRSDSNERPLGYEPNELPTAPLRDIFDCKGTTFLQYSKVCADIFSNSCDII